MEHFNNHLPEKSEMPKRSRKKSPREDLLTASEALRVLQISKTTFQRLVRAEKIPKETPFGRKEGYYPRVFIETLASHLKGQVTYKEVATLLDKMMIKDAEQLGGTDWIQTSDLPYVLALDYEVYGSSDAIDISITSRWWSKNPHQCRILFDKVDRTKIWGVLTIMPLPLEVIYRLLSHQMTEREISPDDIQNYEQGNLYDGYVASAIIRPAHRAHFRMLIQSVFTFWCERYPSIQLRRLYAYASTDEGFDLIQQMLFSPRYDLGDNAYELDPMRRNRSKLIKSFQDCIKQKEKHV